MKKKIIAVIVAAVMAVGCFSTASAADYREIREALKNGKQVGNTAERKAYKLLERGWSSDIVATSKTKVANYMGSGDDWTIRRSAEDAKELGVVEPQGINIEWLFEIVAHFCAQYPKDKVIRIFSIQALDADEDEAVEVTIADTDIKAGKTYALRHIDFDTGEWDTSTAEVTASKAGLIKAKVKDSSSYILVEIKGAAAEVTTTAPAANNTAEGNTAAANANTAATTSGANAAGKTAAKTGEV